MQKSNIIKKYSRRDFFKFLLTAISVSALFWWLVVGKRDQSRMIRENLLFVASDIPSGISFYDQIVLIKEKGIVRAYKARCTHLGCKIKKAEGKELVCQCHGSRFDMEGNVIQGPAGRPLTELKILLNKDTGGYEVMLDG